MSQMGECNCGYNGEDQNGTRKVLEELGVDQDVARKCMLEKHFSWKRGER